MYNYVLVGCDHWLSVQTSLKLHLLNVRAMDPRRPWRHLSRPVCTNRAETKILACSRDVQVEVCRRKGYPFLSSWIILGDTGTTILPTEP